MTAVLLWPQALHPNCLHACFAHPLRQGSTAPEEGPDSADVAAGIAADTAAGTAGPRLCTPASVLGLHVALLRPGLGRRGSHLRPVVPRLLGQQLHSKRLIISATTVAYIQGHASGEAGDAGMEGHAQAAMQYYSHDSMQVPCSCLDCPQIPQDAPF